VGPPHGKLQQSPLKRQIAAVSVGIYAGTPVLDLDYAEDSSADTDMNVVMADDGGLIEIQGTAEAAPFSRTEMSAMLDLATIGIEQIIAAQRAVLTD
jgi:ribonuclease PH